MRPTTMREAEPAISGSRSFLPSPPLREFVKQYNYLTIGGLATPQPVPPTIHPRIVFFLGAPFDAYEYEVDRNRRLPGTVIAGLITHRVADVATKGPMSMLSVIFQPTGLGCLFRIDQSNILDNAYDSVDVLGTGVASLYDRLMEAVSLERRIQLLEEFLLENLRFGAQVLPWVQHAAGILGKARGIGDVSSLLQPVPISDRQLRRQFISHIGVSPKVFHQIVRLNHVFDLMRRFPLRTLGRIGMDAGFYDSSHLYAEFQRFIYQSPSEYLGILGSAQSEAREYVADATSEYLRMLDLAQRF